jgi:hypothetical protein
VFSGGFVIGLGAGREGVALSKVEGTLVPHKRARRRLYNP